MSDARKLIKQVIEGKDPESVWDLDDSDERVSYASDYERNRSDHPLNLKLWAEPNTGFQAFRIKGNDDVRIIVVGYEPGDGPHYKTMKNRVQKAGYPTIIRTTNTTAIADWHGVISKDTAEPLTHTEAMKIWRAFQPTFRKITSHWGTA